MFQKCRESREGIKHIIGKIEISQWNQSFTKLACSLTSCSTSESWASGSQNSPVSRAILCPPLSCTMYLESQLFRPQFPYLERTGIRLGHWVWNSFLVCLKQGSGKACRALSTPSLACPSQSPNFMEAACSTVGAQLARPGLAHLGGPFPALMVSFFSYSLPE